MFCFNSHYKKTEKSKYILHLNYDYIISLKYLSKKQSRFLTNFSSILFFYLYAFSLIFFKLCQIFFKSKFLMVCDITIFLKRYHDYFKLRYISFPCIILLVPNKQRVECGSTFFSFCCTNFTSLMKM